MGQTSGATPVAAEIPAAAAVGVHAVGVDAAREWADG